eukprot:TRINITY_DN14909_c0_g1_i1.p1 TRINITY_DN14909_c0_g1~~TRINITY_DN14909_c0_g1_i1.p1  ORF type:complete len:141 (-),score=23.71 TRINITY_DN14909_c0_g1_i1:68-490(-)
MGGSQSVEEDFGFEVNNEYDTDDNTFRISYTENLRDRLQNKPRRSKNDAQGKQTHFIESARLLKETRDLVQTEEDRFYSMFDKHLHGDHINRLSTENLGCESERNSVLECLQQSDILECATVIKAFEECAKSEQKSAGSS